LEDDERKTARNKTKLARTRRSVREKRPPNINELQKNKKTRYEFALKKKTSKIPRNNSPSRERKTIVCPANTFGKRGDDYDVPAVDSFSDDPRALSFDPSRL